MIATYGGIDGRFLPWLYTRLRGWKEGCPSRNHTNLATGALRQERDPVVCVARGDGYSVMSEAHSIHVRGCRVDNKT